MPRNRLVPLTDDLPEAEGFPLKTCNYCDRDGVHAVVAKEHDGKDNRFYGMCGNHAEVSNLKLNIWTKVK